MKLRVRNISYMPILDREGTFLCPMPSPPPQPEGQMWFTNLKPHERLFHHQTLASVRYCKRYVPTSDIPRDSLDFQLQACYDHGRETFGEKVDSVLQLETCASASAIYGLHPDALSASAKTSSSPPVLPSDSFLETFRVLRNTKMFEIKKEDTMGHPLRFGGIKQKNSPHSVKLINSGPHTQLVNNGYSRQTADGNFFRY